MQYFDYKYSKIGATAQVSAFTAEGGATEWNVMLHVDPQDELFEGQLRRIQEAEALLLQEPRLEGAQCVMKRYFLSDSTNQVPLIPREPGVSVSLIQQQPLDGSKIVVWMYLVDASMTLAEDDGTVVVSHNGYRHLWRMGLCSTEGDSAQQTTAVLREYEDVLAKYGATLADNCVRTWFFVRDVDTQYAGMVRARRENFIGQGLTEKTHYIASTGICGVPAHTKAIIQLGTYAVTGLQPSQITYIYGKTHLNPTYEYGVTFERGTAVDYGDRRHVIISGTASINNKGEVLHVGDIVNQTRRMWENVETLLAEAGTTFDDVAQIVVYLRDTADYALVRRMFLERFPRMPLVIALAPVCRPAWLIEMECIAVKARTNDDYRAF